MIKAEDSGERTCVTITGAESDVLAEFTAIVRALKKGGIIQENIKLAIKLGLSEEEEMQDLIKKELHEKIERLFEDLNEEDEDRDEAIEKLMQKLKKRFNKE